MKKSCLFACLCGFVLLGSAQAATKSVWVDKGKYSGDSYRYYTYSEGDFQSSPCCWGWSSADAGSWLKMTWETGVGFSKNWTAEWDVKQKDSSKVKAWPHVKTKRGKFSIKCDSNMKSSYTFKTKLNWSNKPFYFCNIQLYGSQHKSGNVDDSRYWSMDMMIRTDYTDSKAGKPGWSLVTVAGKEWYYNKVQRADRTKRYNVVYCAKNKTRSVSNLKAKDFMTHAGFSGWYLGSMEVGWEPILGGASFKVTEMKIKPWG
jgi:hypothetical protein